MGGGWGGDISEAPNLTQIWRWNAICPAHLPYSTKFYTSHAAAAETPVSWNAEHLLIITADISIALNLIDKGEHTALYKINDNVYIKTKKIINDSSHNIVTSHEHTHTRTHTHTQTHTASRYSAHNCASLTLSALQSWVTIKTSPNCLLIVPPLFFLIMP